MTRLEYDDVIFYQNEEKRVTVAILNGCSLDAYMDFLKETDAPIQDEKFITSEEFLSIPEEFMMPATIESKSTCNKVDNWDPEVGKKQAFFKLCRTYNKMKYRVFKRMIKYHEDHIKVFNKMIVKNNNSISHYDNLVRKGIKEKTSE